MRGQTNGKEGGVGEKRELLPADSTILKNTNRLQFSPCQYITGREIIFFSDNSQRHHFQKTRKYTKCAFLSPQPPPIIFALTPIFVRPKCGKFLFVRGRLLRRLQQVMWSWNGKRRLNLFTSVSRAHSTLVLSTLLVSCVFCGNNCPIRTKEFLLDIR